MTKMADILQSTRAWLGGYGEDLIPEVMTDADTIKAALADWLKEHAETLKLAGSTVSLGLVHMVMGMLLAVLVFFRHVTHHADRVPGTLSEALEQKVERFARAFAQIASAQVKISLLNTVADRALRARGAAAVRTAHPVRDHDRLRDVRLRPDPGPRQSDLEHRDRDPLPRHLARRSRSRRSCFSSSSTSSST